MRSQTTFLDWRDDGVIPEETPIDLLVLGLGRVGEVGGQGIRTMLRAKEVVLVAWGEHKAGAVRDTVEGEVSDAGPASKLQFHDHAHSAIAEADPSDFDFDTVMRDADWFHWSGITPAISDKAVFFLALNRLIKGKKFVRNFWFVNF